MNREPIQLEFPFVQKHERDLDYYWDRHERHMSAFENRNDNVYIYDLDYTTFERPKIFTHKPTFSFQEGFKWEYSLAWYIFWDSFIVSLFDKPLPLAKEMKDKIKQGLNVGIFSARSEKWFSNLWVRLKIGKGVSFTKFRPKNDNTADHELKERYLRECLDTYTLFQWSPRIVAYDDKKKIIDMYKQNDVEGVLV